MLRYIFKRLVWLIPVIIIVSFIVYSLMEMAPGSIVDRIMADAESMRPEDIEALRIQYNLHMPMIYRYGLYMLNLVQGDLGVSDISGLSVWSTYLSRLPNTLLLSFSALIIGSGMAVPMGIFAAKRAGKIVDNATTTFTLIGMSMPAFWLGLLLLLLFSFQLRWLPAGGNRDGIASLILPAVCSGLILMATATRQTRSSMLEVLGSDYLRTARAKGVPENVVINRHALSNAMIPILTTIGTSLCVALAGSVVVESVFAWPGVGRMAAEAVLQRDVTTVTGCVILTTVIYVLVQLIVDLLFAFVDPRIKSQYVGAGKKKRRASASEAGSPGKDTAKSEPRMAQPAVEHSDARKDRSIPALIAQEQGASSGKPDTDSAPTSSYVTRDLSLNAIITDYADETANQDSLSGAEGLVAEKYRKRSQIGDVFYRVRKNRGAMAGLVIFALLLLTLLASLLISFESITEMNVLARFTAPNRQYLFGTDNMGRDMFLRVLYGIRYSLAIGFGAVCIGAVFGVLLGAFAGYYGGIVDDVVMRVSDILASIPGMLLGMVIVTVLGQSLINVIVAVGIPIIPVFIRITRASILTVRNNEYVEAARAIGMSSPRIVFGQVLPNGLSPIIVTITASLGISIIVSASLSFLGFGVPVPHPEWGALIAENREFARSAPWLMTFPGLFIMITVLALNLLGDGLRDALDPKLKR